MKKVIYILSVATLLGGCLHRGESMKHEQGFVVEKQYFPDTRQTVEGTGFSTSGDVVFTSHQMGADERFILVFKCEHGIVFSINRSDLYAKLNKGDSVIIDYYELRNRSGEIKDFDLINANVKR